MAKKNKKAEQEETLIKQAQQLEEEQDDAAETKDDTEQTSDEIAEEATESSQIKKLEEEIKQLEEKNLRQYAEFDNYRKRTQREKLETYKNATADCALEFISVLDNLERAVDSSSEESEIKTGVEMIVTQFKQVLEKMGIQEIQAHNQPFNPELHNAVNQIEDVNYGENTICQVLQKGYKINEKVIRPAMVVVANP